MLYEVITRIGTIAAFSLLFSQVLKHEGVMRALFLVLCLLIPFVTAASSLLWRLSYTAAMFAVTAGLPAVSGIFLYFKLRPGASGS